MFLFVVACYEREYSEDGQHDEHVDPIGDGEDDGVHDDEPEQSSDDVEPVKVNEKEWGLAANECGDGDEQCPDE